MGALLPARSLPELGVNYEIITAIEEVLSQLWIHVISTKSYFPQHVQTFNSFNENPRQSSSMSPRSVFSQQ